MSARAPRLIAIAAALFGRDLADRTFAPLVADWQHEWHHATGTVQRARVLLRGGLGYATTSLVTAGHLARPWDLPRRDVRSIGLTFAAYAVFGLGVGLAPFVLAPLVARPLRVAFLVTLAPALLAVSLPVALLPTAAALERRARQQWPVRAPWVLAAVAAIVMCGLVAHVGWLVPAANVEFRARVASAVSNRPWSPPRGVKELTLPELMADAPPAGTDPPVTASARRQEAGLRLALITVWPVVFALFGWRLSRHRREPGAFAVTLWWTLAIVSTMAVSFGASFGPGPHQLPSVVAAATPWLLAAAALRRQRRYFFLGR